MGRRLTDIEALMWSLDNDPNLASTTGSVAILEQMPDPEAIRTTIAHAVAHLEVLRERIVDPGLPIADPEWVVDRHFDLDHHVRFTRLAGPAGIDRLFEAATHLVNDPFDRTRPLWQMTMVSGLPRGRAALVTKAHHCIADGQGLVRLALQLFDLMADAPPKPPIDLDAHIADLVPPTTAPKDVLFESVKHRVERVFGLVTGTAGSISSPGRAATTAGDLRHIARLLTGDVADRGAGSPLWSDRSRNRRSTHLIASLPDLKRQATELGISVNDLFVVACAEAAIGYHEAEGAELPHLSISVVISTRTSDDPDAHNAFVPCGIVLPGNGADTGERLEAVRHQVRDRRQAIVDHRSTLDIANQLATLVPSAIAAATALAQTRRFDFATSNLPGPPVPLWLAGSRVESMHPFGPVAGTAFNATLLSYLDEATIGLHVDPHAVDDAPALAEQLRSSLGRLDVSSRRKAGRQR